MNAPSTASAIAENPAEHPPPPELPGLVLVVAVNTTVVLAVFSVVRPESLTVNTTL